MGFISHLERALGDAMYIVYFTLRIVYGLLAVRGKSYITQVINLIS